MTANARCSRRKVPSVAGYNRLTTLSREVSIGENRRISPLLHQSCQGIIRVSPVESSRPLIAAFALCIDPVVARDRNFSICRALSAAKDHQSHIAILLSIFGKNIASYRVVYESVLWRILASHMRDQLFAAPHPRTRFASYRKTKTRLR